MQNFFSCIEFLNNLNLENDDFSKETKIITSDIALLKRYLSYWEFYSMLLDFRNILLPPKYRNSSKNGFFEDYSSYNDMKNLKSASFKGSTKFVFTLLWQNLKTEGSTITDMVKGKSEEFLEDYGDELGLSNIKECSNKESKNKEELIKDSFKTVEIYEGYQCHIKHASTFKYSMLEYSEEQFQKIKNYLLKFLIYQDDKAIPLISYSSMESYLNEKNFLSLLEEETKILQNATSKDMVQKSLSNIMFLLSKLRMGITGSKALQTREITKDKGRKNLLDISTKLNLNELQEEIEQLYNEIDDLIEPLTSSSWILFNLYKHYFENRGNLDTKK